MLKDIVYWTYRLFESGAGIRTKNWHWSDSIFFIATFLLINILTVVYLIEYYWGLGVLKSIPVTTRRDFQSWRWAAIILFPMVLMIYFRYYRGNRFERLLKSYEDKSSRRLMVGRLWYIIYCLGTWVAFFIVIENFKH